MQKFEMRACPRLLCNKGCIVEISKADFNLPMSTPTKPVTSDPRIIFEAALAVINNDNDRRSRKAEAVLRRTRPLRTHVESTRLQQERALNDAAEALAKLWRK